MTTHDNTQYLSAEYPRIPLVIPLIKTLGIVILLSSFVILAIPIPELILVPVGFFILSISELAYLVIILSALGVIAFSHRTKTYLYMLVGLGTIILFKLVLQTLSGQLSTLNSIIRQLRFFVPLFGSMALLSSTLTFPYKKIENLIALAAIINSTIALYIYFFAQDILTSSEALKNVALASDDRLVNANAHSALFILFFIAISGKKPLKSNWLLYLAFMASTASLFFALSRTLIIGLCLLTIACFLMGAFHIDRKAFLVILTFPIVVILVAQIVSQDPRLYQLVIRRLSIRESTDYYNSDPLSMEGSITGRYELYEEYTNLILSNPVLGQDVGRGLTQRKDIYGQTYYVLTTDISFLTMFFIYGIPGVIILMLFLRKIFKTTQRNFRMTDMAYLKIGWLYTTLFAILLLISLNDDILTRKNPIFLLSILSVIAIPKTSDKNV